MIAPLKARIAQKHRTVPYPDKVPPLPERYRGCPSIKPNCCPTGCDACAQACPTTACTRTANAPAIDLGKCLFCGACAQACPASAITFTQEHRMAARNREDLIITPGRETHPPSAALEPARRALFHRSLRLRQVSAGGCNACEADTNVLGTLVFDLGRFGIQFVASPRHADGILITGPVTQNMALALQKTYDAVPDPKVVIVTGACAISGGIFAGHPQTQNGATGILPIDLYIPGCPPHPLTILDGLLRLIGKIS